MKSNKPIVLLYFCLFVIYFFPQSVYFIYLDFAVGCLACLIFLKFFFFFFSFFFVAVFESVCFRVAYVVLFVDFSLETQMCVCVLCLIFVGNNFYSRLPSS